MKGVESLQGNFHDLNGPIGAFSDLFGANISETVHVMIKVSMKSHIYSFSLH